MCHDVAVYSDKLLEHLKCYGDSHVNLLFNLGDKYAIPCVYGSIMTHDILQWLKLET